MVALRCAVLSQLLGKMTPKSLWSLTLFNAPKFYYVFVNPSPLSHLAEKLPHHIGKDSSKNKKKSILKSPPKTPTRKKKNEEKNIKRAKPRSETKTTISFWLDEENPETLQQHLFKIDPRTSVNWPSLD